MRCAIPAVFASIIFSRARAPMANENRPTMVGVAGLLFGNPDFRNSRLVPLIATVD